MSESIFSGSLRVHLTVLYLEILLCPDYEAGKLRGLNLWSSNRKHRRFPQVWKYLFSVSVELSSPRNRHILQKCDNSCPGWLWTRMILIRSCPFPDGSTWSDVLKGQPRDPSDFSGWRVDRTSGQVTGFSKWNVLHTCLQHTCARCS